MFDFQTILNATGHTQYNHKCQGYHSTFILSYDLRPHLSYLFDFVLISVFTSVSYSSSTSQVVLGRRLLGVFMTIYMPTILMNIVGHSTMFFKPFFFEAQVLNKRLKILKCHDVFFPGLSQPNGNAGAHNNVCQVNLHIAGAILKA